MLKELYETEFEPTTLYVAFEYDNPIPIYGEYNVDSGLLTLDIETGSWVDDLPEDDPMLQEAKEFAEKHSGFYASDRAVNDMLKIHGIRERLGLSY